MQKTRVVRGRMQKTRVVRGRMQETRVLRRRMLVMLLSSGVMVTYLKWNQKVSCEVVCMWQF